MSKTDQNIGSNKPACDGMVDIFVQSPNPSSLKRKQFDMWTFSLRTQPRTNSPPASAPACCSVAPEENWGCCRRPASAGQSNTWRRRWPGRWCWTGAAPGSDAPSHSCRTWRKTDHQLQNLTFLWKNKVAATRFMTVFCSMNSCWWVLTLTCPPPWCLWGSGSSRRSTPPDHPKPWRPAG